MHIYCSNPQIGQINKTLDFAIKVASTRITVGKHPSQMDQKKWCPESSIETLRWKYGVAALFLFYPCFNTELNGNLAHGQVHHSWRHNTEKTKTWLQTKVIRSHNAVIYKNVGNFFFSLSHLQEPSLDMALTSQNMGTGETWKQQCYVGVNSGSTAESTNFTVLTTRCARQL